MTKVTFKYNTFTSCYIPHKQNNLSIWCLPLTYTWREFYVLKNKIALFKIPKYHATLRMLKDLETIIIIVGNITSKINCCSTIIKYVRKTTSSLMFKFMLIWWVPQLIASLDDVSLYGIWDCWHVNSDRSTAYSCKASHQCEFGGGLSCQSFC